MARRYAARATLYVIGNPCRQLGYRSVQPSSRFAFAFEAPRICVIMMTASSPATSFASQGGTFRGGGAPSASAKARITSRAGAGSSSATL